MNEMRTANRKSIFCDDIENVTDGSLIYTNELVAKVKNVFNMDLPKTVKFENIDETAEFIIKNIIEPFAPNKWRKSLVPNEGPCILLYAVLDIY